MNFVHHTSQRNEKTTAPTVFQYFTDCSQRVRDRTVIQQCLCTRVHAYLCEFWVFGECLLVMPFRTHRELVRCCVLAWHEFFCVIKMICRAKCSLDTIFLVHHKTITVNQSGSQSLNNTQSVRTFHSNYPY